jgi:hypothetical protein
MNLPNIAPEEMANIQKQMRHLQRCIGALEKIKGITPDSPSAQIAEAALLNKPQAIGGTVDG